MPLFQSNFSSKLTVIEGIKDRGKQYTPGMEKYFCVYISYKNQKVKGYSWSTAF